MFYVAHRLRRAAGRGFAVILLLLPAPAAAAEVLVEGFENVARLRPVGKVTVVSGADAVTEGRHAVQLFPGSAVEIQIPARAVSRPGWLKLDTFESQPVLACLGLSLSERGRRPGYVLPGKDTLAMPLSELSPSQPGPWPGSPATLWVRNLGRHPVIVDNVRLVEPAPAPDGAILLDFGPEGQVLWPGFDHAELDAKGISWSGEARIYSFSTPYPDPLLGDFAGRYPGYRVSETVTLRPMQDPGLAWIWVTHYGQGYSASLESMVKLNGKVSLHRRLGASQMLSQEGLLSGKGEPWTTEWLEDAFVPRVVSRLECPLKGGENQLLLANCQLAAMIAVPRAQQAEMRKYVQELQEDMKRYRRQFVLATRQLPRCDVVPTEEEAQAGVMIFVPPADERFCGRYVPTAEDRVKPLKMVVASGSSTTAAVAVVPCREGRLLQAAMEPPRDPGKGAIPVTGCQVWALEAVPVVEAAAVYDQPYLPEQGFRSPRVRGVYWFLLQVEVPQPTRSGCYRGALRLTFDESVARLPVEVDVFHIGPAWAGGRRTLGVLSPQLCREAYHSLADALAPPQQAALSRQILDRLVAVGFNASLLPGPSVTAGSYEPVTSELAAILKDRLKMEGDGKSLIDMGRVIQGLSPIQPGTGRYQKVLSEVVRETGRLVGRQGLGDFALYCGWVTNPADLPQVAKVVRGIRDAHGRPALSAYGQVLTGADVKELAELFGPLDTLIVTSGRGLLALADAFKKSSGDKTLALLAPYPDTYAYGFYCWGIGADGAYASQAFSSRPLFNAFWFDGRALLAPTDKWGFKPTLSALLAAEGMADYDLTRRCEAIVSRAKQRGTDARELEKVLTEIRTTADSSGLHFDLGRLRSREVLPSRLRQWRHALVREANKLVEPPATPHASAPSGGGDQPARPGR